MVDKIHNMAMAFMNLDATLFGDSLVTYVKDNEKEVIDANVSQMREGKMPDGSDINPLYKSEYYARKKRNDARYNQFDNPVRPFMVPNLGLTGSFYGHIEVVYTESSVEFTDTDSKWEIMRNPLRDKYGDVLGVPEWYMTNTLVPGVTSLIIGNIKNTLGI